MSECLKKEKRAAQTHSQRLNLTYICAMYFKVWKDGRGAGVQLVLNVKSQTDGMWKF